MITRPMRASKLDNIDKLLLPVYCQPKIDGIRCLKVNGRALSRSFKPIPNKYIREWIEVNLPDGLDGELVIKGLDYNDTQSQIMSFEGEPDFEYRVFDYVKDSIDKPFYQRLDDLCNFFDTNIFSQVVQVETFVVANLQDLFYFEDLFITEGYEGLMTRSPDGLYKCGQSTPKEQYLFKLKRFEDSEAKIINMLEQMTNTNEEKLDAFGNIKRSLSKENMVPVDTLGKFVVEDVKNGWTFEIGTGEGLTQDLRKRIWDNKQSYIGKLVKYKYQSAGMKDVPRFPVFIGFRSEIDLD